jgi:hypothetical protein
MGKSTKRNKPFDGLDDGKSRFDGANHAVKSAKNKQERMTGRSRERISMNDLRCGRHSVRFSVIEANPLRALFFGIKIG